MIENAIREQVLAHYARESSILLLSDLGVRLTKAQLWPITEDNRSLADIVSNTNGVSIVRDDKQKAYIIVVPAGEEHRAEAILKKRSSDKILSRLPKSVLVAFCVETDMSEKVHLQSSAPFRYVAAKDTELDGYTVVEEEFRMPGVYVESLGSLSHEETNQLADGFLAWCDRHGFQSSNFIRSVVKTQPQGLIGLPRAQSPKKAATSALERLLAAQAPEVSSRMQIPADIALTLSRMP